MEVKKNQPQLKPCVLVDGTAPGRFVEAVCAAQMQQLRNALDQNRQAPPRHEIPVEAELLLPGSSSPSPPSSGVKVRAVLSAVSSSLSLLLKHIFHAAWCCAMCFFHCWMMMMSLCWSRDFSFSADMHNSVVRINGLPGFGHVCEPDAGSSLLSPV